jgi:hypothetical protein
VGRGITEAFCPVRALDDDDDDDDDDDVDDDPVTITSIMCSCPS